MKSNPNPAEVVLVERIGVVPREPFSAAVDCENIIPEPFEPTVSPNPQITLAVFIKAAHQVLVPFFTIIQNVEPVVPKPRKTRIRAGPKDAIVVQGKRAHVHVG